MLFDLDKPGKIFKKCTSRFFMWKITTAYHMKHKLHQCSEHVLRAKQGAKSLHPLTSIGVPLLRIATLEFDVFLLLILLCGAFIMNVFLAVHIRALPLDLCV